MPPSTLAPEFPGALPDEMPLDGVSLQSGWPDFDAMRPLRPGRMTLLDGDWGHEIMDALYADAAVQGRVVLVADGGNTVDAYRLVEAGRRRALARFGGAASRRDLAAHEEAPLDLVRVARGFTLHQLQAIVEDGLAQQAEAAKDAGLAVGLVAAPGLLNMSLDADVRPEEARVLAQRAIAAVKRLATRLDAPALVTGGLLAPGTMHALRPMLEQAADELVTLRHTRGATMLDFPRRGARFVLPTSGQRRLDDYRITLDERPTPAAPRPAPAGAAYVHGRLWGPRYAPAASWIHGKAAGAT